MPEKVLFAWLINYTFSVNKQCFSLTIIQRTILSAKRTDGRAFASIQSTSLGRGSASGQNSSSQKKLGKQHVASKKGIMQFQ
jgi:exosome complex RNA-binding protein Rrp42 (RNase PH superfamily)